MKKLFVLFALLLSVSAAPAALPQPDLIAQFYFAGAQKIAAATNAIDFANEFTSPQALALRQQTANKLSVWLAGWLNTNCGVNVPDGAARLRPLFDDLQKSEWLFEARLVGGKPDVAIAIKLNAPRMQAWQSALKPFLPAATFTPSGEWMIFDAGTASSGIGAALSRKVGSIRTGWFDMDVNWPCLVRWMPQLAGLGLPEAQLIISAPDQNFHVEGRLIFPQPLAMNLESWKVPANALFDPISSFTAVRGFAGWLRSQAWAQPYQITPTPNQAFIWANKGFTYQTYAAVPVSDSASALQQLYAAADNALHSSHPGNYWVPRLSLLRTNSQFSLQGLPLLAPYAQEASGRNGKYLLFGGFPDIPSSPAPPQLLQQLDSPNLVYYHWEHTAERVNEILQPMQLALMVANDQDLASDSAAFQWLTNTAARFDNTATKIEKIAPDQLSFQRAAPGLFTAAEMYALANWLEARNFPGCDLTELTVTGPRHRHPRPVAPGAPSVPHAPGSVPPH